MKINEIKNRDVYKRALECQLNQRQYTRDSEELVDAFHWRSTREGHDVWLDVYRGKFGKFNRFHNLNPTLKDRIKDDWLMWVFIVLVGIGLACLICSGLLS